MQPTGIDRGDVIPVNVGVSDGKQGEAIFDFYPRAAGKLLDAQLEAGRSQSAPCSPHLHMRRNVPVMAEPFIPTKRKKYGCLP